MENPNSTPTNGLEIICEPRVSSTERVVRERLIRLAELIRKDGAPYPLTPQLVNSWVSVFDRENLTAGQVEAAFDRAETELRFWPAPADILGLVSRAERFASVEAAHLAWEQALAIRREHYNPDFPEHLSRAAATLPERVQRAARAAGVFQEVSHPDQLHVWGKKRFVESFMAWGEIEENESLLPDGEVKNLLTNFAELKALPPSHSFDDLHSRGRAYCQQSRQVKSAPTSAKPRFTPQPMSRSLEEQKRILQEKGFLPG